MDQPAPHTIQATEELETKIHGTVDEWMAFLGSRSWEIGALLSASRQDQQQGGFRHTLREIGQQPVTWIETATNLAGRLHTLEGCLEWVSGDGAPGALVLTGSGSSVYAGECLSPALQALLGLPARAVPAGEVLLQPSAFLPPHGPCLIVSFARSGNSPESCGVLDTVLDTVPECHHLVITCNRQGRLATSYGGDPRVATVVLDDKTCDRSLVMTSSFTNMVLAGRLLGMTRELAAYQAEVLSLARAAAEILLEHGDALARVARSSFRSAVYLGTGCRFGSAREGALKMLEMTSGRVPTFPETYLGLRHGPMCAVDEATLVVCFLSRDAVTRAYEVDLIRELDRKKLGARKVIVGSAVPQDLKGAEDLVIDTPSLGAVGDEAAPVLDVLVGQMLAFFRCLSNGLHPDMPSADGVINRVVEDFVIHPRN